MFHWRVDTNGVTFRAAGDPAPVVKDRKTGELATDQKTGLTMYSVELLVKAPDNRAEVWTVKLVGPPEDVHDGDLVTVIGLVGQDWENGNRHGISWRATDILPASAAKTPAAPKASAGASPPPPPGKAA
jgi:hypothetical protein